MSSGNENAFWRRKKKVWDIDLEIKNPHISDYCLGQQNTNNMMQTTEYYILCKAPTQKCRYGTMHYRNTVGMMKFTSKLQTLTKFHVFLVITTQLRIFYQNEFGKHQIVYYLLIYHVKDMLDFVL